MKDSPNEIAKYREDTKNFRAYGYSWTCRKCKQEKFSRKGAKKIKGGEGFICKECLDSILGD